MPSRLYCNANDKQTCRIEIFSFCSSGVKKLTFFLCKCAELKDKFTVGKTLPWSPHHFVENMDNKSSLPWGISNEKLQPSSLGQITDSKLATFAAGQQKKSRFQKAREGIRCSSEPIAAIVSQQPLTIVRALGAPYQRWLFLFICHFQNICCHSYWWSWCLSQLNLTIHPKWCCGYHSDANLRSRTQEKARRRGGSESLRYFCRWVALSAQQNILDSQQQNLLSLNKRTKNIKIHDIFLSSEYRIHVSPTEFYLSDHRSSDSLSVQLILLSS